MRISVIGTGYLGAVHAAGMAELGHDVIAVDVDEQKIAALRAGRAPFYEPGFERLLRSAIASGRLRFTTSTAEAAASAEVHFVCVGTPQQTGGLSADLGHVTAAVEALATHATQDCLIVGKSTVPVGTAQSLQRLADRVCDSGISVRVAWNPEFLREGFAVQDTLTPDRLVFGVTHQHDAILLREVYAKILQLDTPCVVTDLPTAELVKVAANAFLATKISFINAMAEICEHTGGDVVTLADSIGYDARIGRRFLNSGIGFGGGCLGKDIRAFRARAGELGLEKSVGFLREVDEINDRRRHRVIELAREMLGDLTDRKITVLGASFKPDSDDVRDSPALFVARRLAELGATVTVHDPQAVANARAVAPELNYAATLTQAVIGTELLVHATEWAQYRSVDPSALAPLAAGRRLIDARNALTVSDWVHAGWEVRCLGRSPALTTFDGIGVVASDLGKENVA